MPKQEPKLVKNTVAHRSSVSETPLKGISLKLSGNPVFARSNKVLESKLKVLCQEGKENVQHKAVIESQDLIKLSNSPFMSPKNPVGLLWKVRFYCTLYRCRRGSEGQNIHFDVYHR